MSKAEGIREKKGLEQPIAIEIIPSKEMYETDFKDVIILGNREATQKEGCGGYGVKLSEDKVNGYSGATGLNFFNLKVYDVATGIEFCVDDEKYLLNGGWVNKILLQNSLIYYAKQGLKVSGIDIVEIDCFGHASPVLKGKEVGLPYWSLDAKRGILDAYIFDIPKWIGKGGVKFDNQYFCPYGDMQLVGKSLFHWKDGLINSGAQRNNNVKSPEYYYLGSSTKGIIPELHNNIGNSGNKPGFVIKTFGNCEYLNGRGGKLLTSKYYWSKFISYDKNSGIVFEIPLGEPGKLHRALIELTFDRIKKESYSKIEKLEFFAYDALGRKIEYCVQNCNYGKNDYDIIELLTYQKNRNSKIHSIKIVITGKTDGYVNIKNISALTQYVNYKPLAEQIEEKILKQINK